MRSIKNMELTEEQIKSIAEQLESGFIVYWNIGPKFKEWSAFNSQEYINRG